MQNQFLEKYGPWAVVTGASSGIGAAFARNLAQSGINLVLVARRLELLKTIKADLEKTYAVQIRLAPVDLSKEDFLPQLIQVTQDIPVGLLVNSAGFSIVNDFLQNDLQHEVDMLQVNTRALLILTHHFGQKMKNMGRGGIILLSSVAAFIPSPPWSNYVATKTYIRILGECLAEELKKDGIDVLTLCPGGTETEFQKTAGADSHNGNLFLRFSVTDLSPIDVAQAGLRWLGRKNVAIVGFRNRFLAFLVHFVPRRLAISITYRVMENFKAKS